LLQIVELRPALEADVFGPQVARHRPPRLGSKAGRHIDQGFPEVNGGWRGWAGVQEAGRWGRVGTYIQAGDAHGAEPGPRPAAAEREGHGARLGRDGGSAVVPCVRRAEALEPGG